MTIARFRRIGMVLAGCASLLAVAACHPRGDRGAPGDAVLRIGDQSHSLELPLELAGQDKGHHARFEWLNFADGPHMNAAFIADEVDIGAMGDTPVLLARSARADVVVVAARRVPPNTFTQLVARPGSGIRTLADLRGRRVAFTKGTAYQGYLALALDSAHLGLRDVNSVDLPIVSLGNALETGSADAAVLSGPHLTNYLLANPRAVAIDAPVRGYGILIATRKALADPAKAAAIDDFLTRLVRAGHWVLANRAAWREAYYVKFLHQTAQAADQSEQRREALPLYEPVSDDLPQTLREQSRLLSAAGTLPGGVDLVGPLIQPATIAHFNRVVAAAAK